MERYLKATEVIDCDTESIKEKAQSLTKELETDREKAIALFYFVRDAIKFHAFTPGYLIKHHKSSATLERGKGYCQHKAVLLVALARAVGIPARLGYSDIKDHLMPRKLRQMMGGNNLLFYHGYAELYINGKWVHASPVHDLEMCRQNRYIPVDFDGLSDARDPAYNLNGELHIEYLRDRGHYEDFPWDEIASNRDGFSAELGVDWKAYMSRWGD